MTKEEIKDLIAAKIAGQGSMVDAGGGLAPILNEIVDMIGGGGGGGGNVIEVDWDFHAWDNDGGTYSRTFNSLEEAGLSQFNEGSTLCVTVTEGVKDYVRIVRKVMDDGNVDFNYVDWTLLVIETIFDMDNNWLQVTISEKLDKTTGENLGVIVEIDVPQVA